MIIPAITSTYTPRAQALPFQATTTASPAVANALEDTFNLSAEGRNVLEQYQGLAPEDQPAYLAQLARLLREGYAGFEVLRVDNRPVTTAVESRMADPRLAGAPPIRKKG